MDSIRKYRAEKALEEEDKARERETRQLQQDLLRSNLQKIAREEEYLKSPEGQAALQSEREKATLGIQKLKGEIADQAEKARRSSPEFAPIEAARLGGLQEQLKSELETQQGLLSDVQNRVSNLKSASATLPAGVAGPVMEKDMATRMMRPALDVEASMQQRIPGTSAALGATRKQLGELVGTVPIPEELGGGTAPTTNVQSIYEDRMKEIIPLKTKAIEYINSLAPGSAEHSAAVQTYGKLSGYADAESKKMDENSRKIPGFTGIAFTQKGAEAVRSDLQDFVPSIQGIDSLLSIGEEFRKLGGLDPKERLKLMARADAIIAGLRGSLRKPLVGGGNPSDADQAIIKNAVADPTTLINNVYTNYAPEKLGELKQAIARRFMASAKANGFNADSIQSILDSNRDPKDIANFRSRKSNEFNSEAEARAAGFKDGEEVIVNGGRFILQQD
jgi:hypothetical protein